MSLIDRIRGAARPDPAAVLPEQDRAELDAALDAIARRRLVDAVAELDAALAHIRANRSVADVVDRLLDARNHLNRAASPAEVTP